MQYARNFAVQPGYLTMPLPIASGTAAVPSVVDVYVNNTLQGQQQVAPGPFELSNVPVPSGNGTVAICNTEPSWRSSWPLQWVWPVIRAIRS